MKFKLSLFYANRVPVFLFRATNALKLEQKYTFLGAFFEKSACGEGRLTTILLAWIQELTHHSPKNHRVRRLIWHSPLSPQFCAVSHSESSELFMLRKLMPTTPTGNTRKRREILSVQKIGASRLLSVGSRSSSFITASSLLRALRAHAATNPITL